MTSNPVVTIPLALGLFAPALMLVAIRPRVTTARGNEAPISETCFVVIVSVLLT